MYFSLLQNSFQCAFNKPLLETFGEQMNYCSLLKSMVFEGGKMMTLAIVYDQALLHVVSVLVPCMNRISIPLSYKPMAGGFPFGCRHYSLVASS